MLAIAGRGAAAEAVANPRPLFCIGVPDGAALEFGLVDRGWPAYQQEYRQSVVFTVGQSKPQDWPYIQPSTHDAWAGSQPHTFTIRFRCDLPPAEPQFLIVGLVGTCTPSRMTILVNDRAIESRKTPDDARAYELAGDPQALGKPTPLVFALPADAFQPGDNRLAITLDDGSWIVYDYVQLGPNREPPKLMPQPVREILPEFLAGPMLGVDEIVFAVRRVVGEHWYANFGYYAAAGDKPYFNNAGKLYREGGKLCRLNIRTGQLTTLLDDPQGGVRDPQVHYDGKKILFSYRKGDSPYYQLYEINSDGTGLQQLTDAPYDDIEPTYMPDGSIVFVSSRCNRWVNCWLTHVAVLHRCDADGRNVRPLSSNNEHDNTPWPLPDGRILYTRWEYVDRSQVDYHHLWIVNPDGSGQMVYYGNMRPGTVMIDAKPIANSNAVVVCFSPGHGQTEHEGTIAVVDPSGGPDAAQQARVIRHPGGVRDPWAFSTDCFLAARGPGLCVIDGRGRTQAIFELPPEDIRAGLQCHEPRPLISRPRERIIAPRSETARTSGRLVLADVYVGRNMAGVPRGEIKKLLVLETLPKPINFTGGMEPLSYGGTFTLERILGTVPVEADGSAHFEVPALRSVFFVALDEHDIAVKRMQSFVTVQPGETVSCVGCHEQRTATPQATGKPLLALRRPPRTIEPIAGVPDVIDFPRDIQPILDRHCLKCHDWDQRAGGVVLSGDRGPMFSHSYFALTARNQIADGRNKAQSNYAPRALGSAASPLMRMIEPGHYDVRLTPQEHMLVRLWIDTGAPFPGTYAALGCGMVGGYAQNQLSHPDAAWPSTSVASEALQRRCSSCHTGPMSLPLTVTDNLGRHPWELMGPDDPRRRYSRHLLYNLTRPDQSLLLLAPLAKSAGGYGVCTAKHERGESGDQPAEVFSNAADPDYAKILAAITDAKNYLDQIKRFDMLDFRPRPEWLREMKRYGILPGDLAADAPVDVYAVERSYWESLWYRGK